ncbi:MAG: VWA domain-containing protein [Verrucomicrobia bacterium]|nr:VWA domain-containing protein [Verrucomicrobiota bacterium]
MKRICFLSLLVVLVWRTATPVQAQQYSDNVVIVLDASGSMREVMPGTRTSKMDAAKTALKEVLKQVPPSTQLGLLVFSAANLRNDWVYPLGPRNDEVLLAAIDQLQPNSGTPLGSYIKKGADRLLEERTKQFGYGTYRLLVVTDGEAQDQNLVNSYTPDVMSRGITMDVIGVAMRGDHTLATKVHSYRRANDPEALRRAIREVFAEVAGSAADTAQAEAFELLAPIPTGVANAMIQALSTSGNHPIGTRPKSVAARAQAAATPSPKPPQVQSPQPPPPPRAAPPAPGPSSRGHSSHLRGFWIAIPCLMCFGGVAALIVLIVALARRGRRR